MTSRTSKSVLMIVLLATVAWYTSSAMAQDEAKKATVKAGYLTCHVASGWGFIFGSSREIACTYSEEPNYSEFYSGTISKFGVDIGYLRSGVILWAVIAPTAKPKPGVLGGHYAGASASAALGVGAGAHVLIGGFNNSIALQPVAIEAQNGLNVAAGIDSLELHFVSGVKVQ